MSTRSFQSFPVHPAPKELSLRSRLFPGDSVLSPGQSRKTGRRSVPSPARREPTLLIFQSPGGLCVAWPGMTWPLAALWPVSVCDIGPQPPLSLDTLCRFRLPLCRSTGFLTSLLPRNRYVPAVCGEYTPAGVLFRLARRPAPQPEGRGFVVVGVGEGARGALGHRGDRYPVGGRIHTPAESANWWGGHAAYYGQVGPRLVGMVRHSGRFPAGDHYAPRRSRPHPSHPPSVYCIALVW